jgi:hypothetical protein
LSYEVACPGVSFALACPGHMKLDLEITWDVKRNRPGETDADEREADAQVRELVEEFARVLREKAEAEGLEVAVRRG